MSEIPEHTFNYEQIVKQTDKALLLEIEGIEVWIPKSQVLSHDEDQMEMTIPGWLAKDKDLI